MEGMLKLQRLLTKVWALKVVLIDAPRLAPNFKHDTSQEMPSVINCDKAP